MERSWQWVVTQIGSREHYFCPLGFYRRGRLERLYTDVWAGAGLRALGKVFKPASALATRYNPEIPSRLVRGFNVGGLGWIRKQKRKVPVAWVEASYRTYNEIGEWFSREVVEDLKRRPVDVERCALYTFSTGALETVRYAKSIGLRTIVNQLDPARTDQILIAEEVERWPGWMGLPGKVPELYFERLSAEWEGADLVAVNSEFSRRALKSQGVDEGKVFVVPLAYEPEVKEERREVGSGEVLEVLWLGQIVLRKGIGYLFEAGRILERRGVKVRITVAGTVGISDEAVATRPANVNFLGRVPREKALELYASSDVFVLPTISDGFAITQLEAMSYGLPVIATPNCGDVVTEGKDGFIVPIRDPQTLADRIELLAGEKVRLREMSVAARAKSKTFTLERYTSTIESEAAKRWR